MRRFAVCMVVFCLAVASIAFAGEEDAETIKVMAVGMGVDSDAALKSALRNAVVQAVGSIVDSETMVHNDEVIDDKILSHSGGFVEEYDMIGEPKAQDGLVSVRIEAVVKRMNLKREMEANDIFLVKKVDGKVFTKQIQMDEAATMLTNMMKGFPENYIDVKMKGEPYLNKNGKFALDVTTTLDVDKVKALTKDLIAFFDAALPEPGKDLRSSIKFYESGPRLSHLADYGYPSTSKNIYLPIFINENYTMCVMRKYQLTDELIEACYDLFFKPSVLRIDLTIDGGVTIVSKRYYQPQPINSYLSFAGTTLHACIMPLLNREGNFPTADFKADRENSVTFTYTFDLSAEDAKLIKDVKLSITK